VCSLHFLFSSGYALDNKIIGHGYGGASLHLPNNGKSPLLHLRDPGAIFGFSAITRQRTSAQWLERMAQCHVAAGPIYRINEVFADPQVQHLGIATPVGHPRLGPVNVVGQPFSMSRTPSQIRRAAPDCGEHTDAILHELGYADAEIAAFHERKIV